MEKAKKRRKIAYIVFFAFMILEAVLQFAFHRRYFFCKDDLWYATNLVTGEPLTGIADIIEGQVWHYFNWGGRSINHGLLQFVLMQGELFADILNIIVTFTLCYFICKLAGAKGIGVYCVSFFLLISLSTDIHLSMFWQSGAVNYLYPTNWILLFLLIYIRHVREPELRKLPGVELWIVPLGFITGWSNENMGPACFLATLMVIFYWAKLLKKKIPVWMWLGSVSSLVGSVILIIAPGNYVRSGLIVEESIWEVLYNRFFSMFMGAFSFLFPTLFFGILFLILYYKAGNKLQPYQIILLLTMLISYGAMILSATFPNRAVFGVMSLGIVLIISFIHGTKEKTSKYDMCLFLLSTYMWGYAMFMLLSSLALPF